jgi:hypothetical protein
MYYDIYILLVFLVNSWQGRRKGMDLKSEHVL